MIYFIKEAGSGDDCHVKIGWTKDASNRLANLQTAHRLELEIVRLLSGCRAGEAALHGRYQSQRLRGEWFRFTADMLTEDFGLPDLPIPQSTRRSVRDTDEGAVGERDRLREVWATVEAAGGNQLQRSIAWLRAAADGAPTVTLEQIVIENGRLVRVPLIVRVPPPDEAPASRAGRKPRRAS